MARGNHQLEAKGMGMIMSMVGVGMLFAPSIAGLLSEPITQYATVDFGPYFTPLLRQYPFLLPNVLGAVISFLSTILILVSVEETLPAEQLRSPKYIPSMDCLISFVSPHTCRSKLPHFGIRPQGRMTDTKKFGTVVVVVVV